MKGYSGYQMTILRAGTGALLAVESFLWIVHGTLTPFEYSLYEYAAPGWLLILCYGLPCFVLSLALAIGFYRPVVVPLLMALLLPVGYYLDLLYPPVYNSYVALLLLCCAPVREPLALRHLSNQTKFSMPTALPLLSWLFLAFSVFLFFRSLYDFIDYSFFACFVLFILFGFPPQAIKPTKHETQIVFFDGVCGLCNRSVDMILAEDYLHYFKFAPLQGENAKKLLDQKPDQEMNTMFYVTDKGTYNRSEAILRIGVDLGGIFAVGAYPALLIPKGLRDTLYGFIARNRYSWFGKRESCRLPTKEERKYFLD